MTAPVRGSYFDGQSAGRHDVHVTLEEGGAALLISGFSLDEPERWPLQRLRALSDHAREYSLTLALVARTADESMRDTGRLTISNSAFIEKLERLCPDMRKQDIHEGTWQRVIKRSALAVGAVALIVFVILPRLADTLAELIPIEREIAFGKSITAQIEWALDSSELGQLHCKSDAGLAALDQLKTRLTKGQDLQYNLEITVFNHAMVNAFAAPGGQIVVMRGLLDEASGPDAVAAVLAHEIGHVESRDATRHALRAAGSAGLLSMVMGDFTGGAVAVFLGERLLQASYTREAETIADEFAINMLNGAAVNSTGMAEFFDQLSDMEKGMPDFPIYFSTHPASAERARRARNNADTHADTRPALDDDAWQALQSVCE